MGKKKKNNKQLVLDLTFLFGSTSCPQEVETALTILHAEMQLYVHVRSELTSLQYFGKETKQKDSAQQKLCYISIPFCHSHRTASVLSNQN